MFISNTTGRIPDLKLPNPDLVQFEDDDIAFFTSLGQEGNEDSLVTLILEYVLPTVMACIKYIEHVPENSAYASRLEFRKAPELYTVHLTAKCDILVLVRDTPLNHRSNRLILSAAFVGIP